MRFVCEQEGFMKTERVFRSEVNIAKSLLKEQAYDLIKNAINKGELVPGRYYSQDQISSELGISRTPVREALIELQNEGILNIHRGKGIEVVTLSKKDIQEILEMRQALEGVACELVAERANDDTIEELYEIIEGQKKDMETKNKKEFLEKDRLFHLLIAKTTNNSRLYSSIEAYRDKIVSIGLHAIIREIRMVEVINEHNDIVEALKQKNPDEARKRIIEHLRGTYKEVLETYKEK